MVYSLFGKLITGFLSGTELIGVDNGGGVNVGATTGQIANAPGNAGQGATQFGRSGNLVGGSIVNPVAVNPAGTGSDYIVGVMSISALTFDAAFRSVEVQANGSFGANGNTKRVKIQVSNTLQAVGAVIAGATSIADSTAVTTNGGGWEISAEIVKYGAAGSNTQMTIHSLAQGTSNTALLVPQLLTLNEAAPIYFYITANAASAAADNGLSFAQACCQN